MASGFLSLCCSALFLAALTRITTHDFQIQESTVDDIQLAFADGRLTSRQLTEYYPGRIDALNPLLRAVMEVNPDALHQAERADRERQRVRRPRGGLHGIPVLLKDTVATKDRLNTTAGSLALLGSIVPRDSGVVQRLRRAGAVVLGKASLSEWAHFRSFSTPNGWCARGGQGRNPYVLSADPCGSSSGSAIAVAVGTQTDGSILCPTVRNAVVGIKPTVGLTSRAGVIPVSPRQDSVGPICRTVSDAVDLLEVMAGYDPRDAEATRAASRYIPQGGYRQFLKVEGLKGKRLGILRKGFFDFANESIQGEAYEEHFRTLRSLADVIAFNNNHSEEERIAEFGQPIFLESEDTSGLGPDVQRAITEMTRLSTEGLERLMCEEKLDAIVTPDATASSILGIGGYPGLFSEAKLIEIAYAFEQATKVPKVPAVDEKLRKTVFRML